MGKMERMKSSASEACGGVAEEGVCVLPRRMEGAHALILFNAELNQCKSRLSLDSDLVLENELVRRVDANSIPALMQTEQEYRRVYQSKLE